MSDLVLPVKRVYFDAIKARVKTQEFRLRNDFWRRRLVGKDFARVIITLGYPPRNDMDRRIEFAYRGYDTITLTHPHFGPLPVEVFAIHLGLSS